MNSQFYILTASAVPPPFVDVKAGLSATKGCADEDFDDNSRRSRNVSILQNNFPGEHRRWLFNTKSSSVSVTQMSYLFNVRTVGGFSHLSALGHCAILDGVDVRTICRFVSRRMYLKWTLAPCRCMLAEITGRSSLRSSTKAHVGSPHDRPTKYVWPQMMLTPVTQR